LATPEHVVIGAGPSAVRAAAAVGGLLLDPDEVPGGVRHPEIPEGDGLVEADFAPEITRAYGAAPDAGAALARGLALRGQVHALPMDPREVLSLFEAPDLPGTVEDWARARAKRVAKRFVGGGLEERTYADWVVQRFGQSAYEHLFADYARARWGDPDDLSVSVARQYHGLPAMGRAVAPGATPAEGWAALCGRLVERRAGVRVEGIRLGEKAVAAVITDQGEVPVAGKLLCAATPPQVVAWLGEAAPEGLGFHAARLVARDRVQVALRCPRPELPPVCHVVGAPFFMVSRHGALPGGQSESDTLVAHLSLGPEHPLRGAGDDALASAVAEALPGALGGGRVSPGGARVQRFTDYDPAWLATPWHPSQNRVMLALAALGILLVGRAGCHRHVDAGQELAFAEGLAAGEVSAHELQRTLLDPPVLLRGIPPSIGRFVAR
jgi:hypothetical protein